SGQRHPPAACSVRSPATGDRLDRRRRHAAAPQRPGPAGRLATRPTLCAVAAVSPSAYAVLATRNHEFYGNRVFDPREIAKLRPSLRSMALPWPHVAQAAEERGLKLVTADALETQQLEPRDGLLIAYDWTPDAERLIGRGV